MKLICKNELGGFYSETSNTGLLLNIKGKKTSLRICEFLLLHQRLNDIDWANILMNTNPHDDIHQFNFNIRSQAVVFELIETIHLRDLVNTAYFYFSLKDILTRSEVSMVYNLNIPSEAELMVY